MPLNLSEMSPEAQERLINQVLKLLEGGEFIVADEYMNRHPGLKSAASNFRKKKWEDSLQDRIKKLREAEESQDSDGIVTKVTSTDWLANPFYDNEDGDASCEDTEQQDLSVPKGDGEQEVMFAQLREKLSMPEDDHVEGRTRYANMERRGNKCYGCGSDSCPHCEE